MLSGVLGVAAREGPLCETGGQVARRQHSVHACRLRLDLAAAVVLTVVDPATAGAVVVMEPE
jgi:hypothetical protein